MHGEGFCAAILVCGLLRLYCTTATTTTDGCRWCGLLLFLGGGGWGLLRVQKIQNKRLNKQRHFRVEILPIQIIGFGLVTNVRWLSGGILHMLRSDLIPQQFCRCIRDVGIYTWEEARL